MIESNFKRNKIFLLLLVVFCVSCVSSEKLLQRGEYDRAIHKTSEKLQKKPGNSKELEILKEAYVLANTFDTERIQFLMLEEREDNWVEIYHTYELLNARQNIVRRLPSQLRNQFEFINYDKDIIEAKNEAALVSYDRGVELMNRGDRLSARDAYDEFYRVRELYPEFRDVNKMLNESLFLGTNNVLFQIENNSGKILPEQFNVEMSRISLKDLNRFWLNFDTYDDPGVLYDYYIVLNIKEISISPERLEISKYEETKEIEDGERLLLDENGNVMKDSDGNDISVPNMVTVSAQVEESIQQKSAIVTGSFDIFSLHTDQLVKTELMSIESVFSHHSAVAGGNQKALSEETAAKIGRKTVPFPSDEALLLDSVDLLKERSRSMMAANRSMLHY